MPTVLDLIGRRRRRQIQGRSLLPLMTGARHRPRTSTLTANRCTPRNHYGWSDLRALRSGRFKFIATTKPELYDLERDPGELTNLYAERRTLADRMAAELAAARQRKTPTAAERTVGRRSGNAGAACRARLHRVVHAHAARGRGSRCRIRRTRSTSST